MVHVGEDNAWFTLKEDQLRGLDGSHVSVATYGEVVFWGLDNDAGADSNEAGGAAILVSDSVIFRPRGIATALAIAAATVLAGVLLRRRRRTPHPRTPAEEEPS